MNTNIQRHIQTFQQHITEDCFLAVVVCFDCLAVSEEAAQKDSCQQCGCHYNAQEHDICPECSSPHFDTHCPHCDSTDIEYLATIVQDWKEYVEDRHEEKVCEAIAHFLEAYPC